MFEIRPRRYHRELPLILAALGELVSMTSTSSARAQSAASSAPATSLELPPPGSPARLRYREDAPIPRGYHVEERIRKGLVIGGAITLGIPYTIGLAAASGSSFRNESGWLALPALGPFITLGRRRADCHAGSEAVSCFGDVMLGFALVLDGMVQTAGATLLLIGVSTRKTELVRNDLATVSLLPGPIGKSGYGLHAIGSF
jgi:hypothetical protein